MTDFSERLRSLRVQKKLSQQELADIIGVNKQTISGYERGVRRPAGEGAREIYEKLADCFNVDVPFLMGLSDVTTILTNPLAQSDWMILDEEGRAFIAEYNHLSSDSKARLLAYARILKDMESHKPDDLKG